MVDLLREFQTKSIPTACDYLSDYCDVYINTSVISREHARSLHSAIPGILTAVFGAPNIRGWVHIEISPEHNAAISRAFRSDGPFLRALIQLTKNPKYSYVMMPEALSDDVRKALAAGATQYLPRLYKNCVHFEKRSGNSGTSDIRESATRQSTIFPRSLSGEYRVTFNAIQFFLHHIVNTATHVPPAPPSQPTTSSSVFSSRVSSTMSTANNLGIPPSLNSSSLGGSQILSTGSGINKSSMPLSSRSYQQQQQQPQSRSIIGGLYEQIMTDYMRQFIPCGTITEFNPIIGTFLLDECIETWIRNSWVSMGQKLGTERMHYITLFVKHIVGGDLRCCYSDKQSVVNYRLVYTSVKSELYALISRLALNWNKDDGYLQVITLWSVWAMAWTLGIQPKNIETETYRPIADGWGQYIMDNALFYIPLTGIFLQRMQTFTYPDKPPPPPQPTSTPFNHFHHPTPVPMATNAIAPKPSDQLHVTYRFMTVFKVDGLIEFLSNVEQGLIRIQAGTMASAIPSSPHINPDAIDILASKYFGGQKSHVQAILKKTYDDLVQLDGGTWNCPNLFIKDATPRSKPLVESLSALEQACIPQQETTTRTWGVSTSAGTKSAQHIKDLQQASKLFASIFSLPKPIQKKTIASTPRSIFSSLQKTTTRSISSSSNGHETPMAGLKNGGFLTEEEKRLVRQGRMQCSHKNIPILGPRAYEVVRPGELMFMVRWIIRFDKWVNGYYHRWKPSKLDNLLPDRLTIRPLADGVNLAYVVIIFVILFAIIL
ncbi:hypothetical protein BDA99DRAFT_503435 [Phascolomyces articulosus]|uniref:Uncharacterized protein n=1 Tax=Phascolomyces articulosus TaxID=60185 RepID=A0AAD5KFL1_9FUNG|nr:hypothetical protein BDA99DRAFT_503435 [Phascolomyces articulosus]